MDRLIHGTAADDSIRVMAAVTTDTVRDVVRRHQMAPTATAALGRTMTGAALLAATQKDFDRLTIKVDCDGPISGIVAEATPGGNVRGYVKEPLSELPPAGNGKFDVGGIVGSGTLYVIRESGFDIGLHKDPYVGSVPLVSGEIGDDIANYLLRSEQIPSAVLLGVHLSNSEPYVSAAGGVIIQVLPGANEHVITMIEDSVAHAPRLTESIRDGAGPEELLSVALGVIEPTILGSHEIRFDCQCSQERALTMVTALGADEVESMLDEDGGAEIVCGFCSDRYVLSGADLGAILARLR